MGYRVPSETPRPGTSTRGVRLFFGHYSPLGSLMTGLSVDPATHEVLRAIVNPDGTVTTVPIDEATGPAPTQSLGQAKKTIASIPETEAVTTTAGN